MHLKTLNLRAIALASNLKILNVVRMQLFLECIQQIQARRSE